MLTDLRKYYLFRILIKRFIMPIGVVRMLDVGTTVEQVALIVAVSKGIALIAEVPSGAISDQIGHKKALVISMIGQAAGMACFFGNNAWWMAAMSILYFMSGTLMTGTMDALLYEWLEKKERIHEHAHISARAKTIANAVSIGSMLFAGLLYAWIWWVPFAIAVAQFVVAAVVISFFDRATPGTAVQKQTHVQSQGILNSYKHFPEALRIMKSTPGLLWVSLILNLFIAISITSTEFHQILLDNIGVSAALFGFVYVAKRIVATTAYGFSARFVEWFKPHVLVGCIFAVLSVHYLLLDSVTNVYTMTAVFILNSFILAVASIANNHYQNVLAPSGSRATVLSMGNLLQQLFMVAASAWVGVAAGWWRIEVAYISIGFIVVILGFFAYIKLQSALKGTVIMKQAKSGSN